MRMKKYRKKPWSEAERKLLLTNYNYMDVNKLAEFLPGRTTTAITSQAWYLRKRGIRFK